ncbi:MAG: helix-turn-helix domain protein [Myxococcales bacterium]|nr:helix-turn-helix domain protein [Myxococcales bacterium]
MARTKVTGNLITSRKRSTPPAAMNLRALRQSLGKTQGEVAREAAMSQPQLSRVEARRDHLISTVRKYVRAMGGEVDVIARVDGRAVLLRDV